MKKTVIFLLCLLISAGFIFAGGGGQQSSGAAAASGGVSGPLTFWYSVNEANQNDPEVVWWRDTIRMFQDKYPNVKLQIGNTPDGQQYLTKITTEVAAGNAPDVFQTWLTGRLEPFVKAGRVQPLNSFLDARPDLKKTISPVALSFSTFGNNYYALPMQKSGEVVFYNKKIFADNNLSVPKSYDEFMNACNTLKAKGILPVVMGNLDVWPGAVPYMMLFNRMNGNALYEEVCLNKNAKFDDPAFANTGKKLQEMIQAGVFNSTANATRYDDAGSQFTSGKAAMIFDGLWVLSNFLDKLGNDLGFFNFPMVAGGKGSANDYVVNYDAGFAISSASKNVPAAQAFLEFLFSTERQVNLAERGKLVGSINLPIDQSKLPPIMADISTAIDNASYGFNAWDNPLGPNIGTEFNLAVQRLFAMEDPVKVFQDLNKLVKIEWE